MKRMRRWTVATTATVAATAGVLAVSPAAQAATAVARWEMSEKVGASVMSDTSGTGLTGAIGADVVTGAATDPGRGYRFPAPPDATRRDAHLVVVPDNAGLDPGVGNLSISVRLRTGAGNQNILQKGQANMSGGYYKIDMVQGVPICLFRDGSGATSAKKWKAPIWDGRFHTITCARQGDLVTIAVDGAPASKNRKTIGSVANSKPLTVGGKMYCNPPTVGCDYFVGVIDYVRVDAG